MYTPVVGGITIGFALAVTRAACLKLYGCKDEEEPAHVDVAKSATKSVELV